MKYLIPVMIITLIILTGCNSHNKSNCLESPNSENCVCEEYEKIVTTEETKEYYWKPLYAYTFQSGIYDLNTIVDTNKDFKVNCSRDKIKDCGKYTCNEINITTCITYENTPITKESITNGICIKAHIKTFDDLSCGELEVAWQGGSLCKEIRKKGCISFYYSRDQLEHQQLLKGCFK